MNNNKARAYDATRPTTRGGSLRATLTFGLASFMQIPPGICFRLRFAKYAPRRPKCVFRSFRNPPRPVRARWLRLFYYDFSFLSLALSLPLSLFFSLFRRASDRRLSVRDDYRSVSLLTSSSLLPHGPHPPRARDGPRVVYSRRRASSRRPSSWVHGFRQMRAER